MASFLLPTSNAAHFHILRVFHQVKQWIGEADNMEATDWGWSMEHNMCVPSRSSLPPAPDELLKTIQNAVTVESMVCNVLSLALNAEGIHDVARCLHAKTRTLIQTVFGGDFW